ncbi:hypothetical protein QTG54_001158 [Skeletonema marinoi]|uniref:Uncharacterized protein n=2 Tax=Skeletonema marinoi TaxID=267567 RepID=A0AAD9DK68_9STRA|nr:hypothetical protein QTG54_001158 [Skeletonema marinoi]|mmetsp:Transcript_28814/g.43278  ORF Transcript_28814/g.43278 Transcript_28814/m.43278 type:complete len:241 (-) Transcript_28814:153-875(-)
MTSKTIAVFLLINLFASAVQAFVIRPATGIHKCKINAPISIGNALSSSTISRPRKNTSLQMGYQLPPSPQGPKGPLDEIKAVLPTIGTAVLVGLFFASPLGGAFFAITNTLFVLAFVTPFLLFAGFQIWSALYTVEAPCPSCGQLPVRALKNGEPTVCLNCGAFSRANEKGDGLELCNNPYDMMNEGGGSGSLFDSLFGGMGGGDGISDFDVMGSGNSNKQEQAKSKKQGTIIDVEVERD